MKNDIKNSEDQRKELRLAYEEYTKDEVPKLKNITAVLTYEYFKYGWEAAINSQNRKLKKNLNNY